MSDSQRSNHDLGRIHRKHKNAKLASKIGIIFDDRELCSVKFMDDHMQGLTSANNKIKAVGNEVLSVMGYEISSNQPASIVGNNALMENTVYQSALTNTYMLQSYLLQKGVAAEFVKKIRVKHCRFLELTLTYCLAMPSTKAASELLKKLENYALVVLGITQVGRSRIGHAGSGGKKSLYLNSLNGKTVRFYIKDRNQAGKYSNFQTKEVKEKIYSEASKVLRVEIILGTKYLKENGLDDPLAWLREKGKKLYETEFDWLRSVLKVDADYRVNKPQKRYVADLNDREKAIVAWHFKGRTVATHPRIQSGEWKKAPIKRGIWETLRVDIDIPWCDQRSMVIPKLGDLLSLNRLYKPAPELLDHCHMHSTVVRRNRQLREKVEAEMVKAEKGYYELGSKAASTHLSVLRNVMDTLRRAGLHVPSWDGVGSDGTTSDVSDLMG